MRTSNEENLKEVDQLASILAAIVTTNFKRCTEGVETLVNEQVRIITDFRENTMDPALDVVNNLGTQLHEKLDTMKWRLLDEVKCFSHQTKCVFRYYVVHYFTSLGYDVVQVL